MLRRRFRAMGTDCELFLKARPRPEALRAMAEAQWEVRRLESIFSRFDPDSELSELNRRGTLRVGPELLEVVDLALAARHRTGGRFDPTVHDALVAAGYDRTFEEVASAEGRGGSPRAFAAVRCAGLGPCGSQDAERSSSIPGSTSISEGSPRATRWIAPRRSSGSSARAWSTPAATSPPAAAGGRSGSTPATARSRSNSATVRSRPPAATVATGRGGARSCTTSSTPPPACRLQGDLLRVTAVAATATEAEVRAKALFLAGAEEAEREANATATPALLVTLDGRTRFAGGLA